MLGGEEHTLPVAGQPDLPCLRSDDGGPGMELFCGSIGLVLCLWSGASDARLRDCIERRKNNSSQLRVSVGPGVSLVSSGTVTNNVG